MTMTGKTKPIATVSEKGSLKLYIHPAYLAKGGAFGEAPSGSTKWMTYEADEVGGLEPMRHHRHSHKTMWNGGQPPKKTVKLPKLNHAVGAKKKTAHINVACMVGLDRVVAGLKPLF